VNSSFFNKVRILQFPGNASQILEDENVPPPNKDQGYLLEIFPPNKILGYCPAGIPRNPEKIESSHTKFVNPTSFTIYPGKIPKDPPKWKG